MISSLRACFEYTREAVRTTAKKQRFALVSLFCTRHLQHAKPFIYGLSGDDAKPTLCETARPAKCLIASIAVNFALWRDARGYLSVCDGPGPLNVVGDIFQRPDNFWAIERDE